MKEKRTLLYLIGAPGAGKSTLAAAIFEGVPGVARGEPFAHVLRPGGIELGGARAAFSGTDVLPMNVQPRVLPFLEASGATVVWGEGDRLANGKFFMAATIAGWRLQVIHLATAPALAAARRAGRGSDQAPAWIRGRETKVAQLASWALLTVDGAAPAEQSAAALIARLPALAALVGRPG